MNKITAVSSSLSAQLASWLVWSQLWLNSSFNETKYLSSSSFDSASNWLLESVQWLTGWNYMTFLCSATTGEQNSTLIDTSNLADRLVSIWVLSENIKKDESLSGFYTRLSRHFDIRQESALQGLKQAVILSHAIKLTLCECENLANQETLWDDKKTGGVSQLLVEAHQMVYQAALDAEARQDGADLFKIAEEFNPEHRSGRNWAFLGFQGANPATDFRSMGMLAVRHLHQICLSEPHTVAKMTRESCDDPVCWYSFALVSIYLTRLSLEFLESGLWLGYTAKFLFGNGKNGDLLRKLDEYDILQQNVAVFSVSDSFWQLSDKAEMIAENSIDNSSALSGLRKDTRILARNRKQSNYKQLAKNKELSFIDLLVDQMLYALDALHLVLVKKFHESWLAAVAVKKVTSVMDTEQFLGEFRTSMADQLWQQCLG